ncbi:hypothetical protein [Curtobacterium sp. 24E2]|nr:hypothetical protein JN350_04120 [Curtobacterium sp. 24E2]
MHAAVVTEFGHAPTWQEFGEPAPGPGEVVVDVVAAGLHPRVRSQADGSHYTSEGALPWSPASTASPGSPTARSATSPSRATPAAPWPSASRSTRGRASSCPTVPTRSPWPPA